MREALPAENYTSRNSAIADKPRNAYATTGVTPAPINTTILTRVTIPTLVALCERMRVKYRGTQKLWIVGDLAILALLGWGLGDCLYTHMRLPVMCYQ